MDLFRILVAGDQIYPLGFLPNRAEKPQKPWPWLKVMATPFGVKLILTNQGVVNVSVNSSVILDNQVFTCLNAFKSPNGMLVATLGPDFVGISPSILSVMQQVILAMDLNEPAMILGESGTGKELVARALHSCGKRARGPFIPCNLAAIPKDLVESELFGHRRGAFTGATRDQAGAFKLAKDGTIFLDELGDAPLYLQAKLLRAVESGKFRSLGASREEPMEARVVSATNTDIWAASRSGRLREDLLERLGCLTIRIPPLRERPQDIGPLIANIWGGAPPDSMVNGAVLSLLTRYEWPGNVRELRNVIGRIRWLCSGLEPTVSQVQRAIDLGWNYSKARAARGSRGDQIKASGLPRSTFYYRLAKGLIKDSQFGFSQESASN